MFSKSSIRNILNNYNFLIPMFQKSEELDKVQMLNLRHCLDLALKFHTKMTIIQSLRKSITILHKNQHILKFWRYSSVFIWPFSPAWQQWKCHLQASLYTQFQTLLAQSWVKLRSSWLRGWFQSLWISSFQVPFGNCILFHCILFHYQTFQAGLSSSCQHRGCFHGRSQMVLQLLTYIIKSQRVEQHLKMK